MERDKAVFKSVSELYQSATTSMGKWMWDNHVQWVADRAWQLAEKYNADAEKAYCAALLHDLGDSKYERGHEDFDTWSKETTMTILSNAGFTVSETAEILEAIRTHSCRDNNLPTSLEGKVLATADGMWHLRTNFFAQMCYMHRPQHTTTYEEWQAWFSSKIERDYNTKIFFEAEKSELTPDYEALMRIFTKQEAQ